MTRVLQPVPQQPRRARSSFPARICKRQKLPLIHCVECGCESAAVPDRALVCFGGVFRNLAQMSAMGLPTMVVLHGGSTAGGAYMPGMSDYVIGVKENGMAALGGAALVKAATGEVANDRELGGTEMHASVSGCVEYWWRMTPTGY